MFGMHWTGTNTYYMIVLISLADELYNIYINHANAREF